MVYVVGNHADVTKVGEAVGEVVGEDVGEVEGAEVVLDVVG